MADQNFTPMQERFIEEYLLTLNASDAIRRAGSKAKNVTVAGSSMLANPSVKAEIDRRKAERSKKIGIDAQWLLARLAAEAEADIADLYGPSGYLLPVAEWPEIWRKGLVAGVETSEEVGPDGTRFGEVVKIKLSDRVKRLELIGKHISVQAFQENIQHKGLEGLADRLARATKRASD